MRIVGKSDIGLVRNSNQDSFTVKNPEQNTFFAVLCDGMGGYALSLIHISMEKKEAESVGKKVDFVIQEMNREINTISSKIGDMDVTLHVIEVKNCIEKIREQIQNIE